MISKFLPSLINKYLSILYVDEETKKDISGAMSTFDGSRYISVILILLMLCNLLDDDVCLFWLQRPFAEKQRNSKFKFIKIHVNQYFVVQLIVRH